MDAMVGLLNNVLNVLAIFALMQLMNVQPSLTVLKLLHV